MNDTATTAREAYDTDTFGVGEPCGVCIYPTGEGQICGNTVYANQAKGRLPKYCGQEGQAEWQAQHGTEGNARHRSDLAGYPRRQLGMTPEDVQTLADAEASRRGITRRLKAETPAPAAPAAPVAPAADFGVPPTDALVLADALPESAVDALAELARLITGRVIAARHEIDSVREDFAKRVAEIEADAEQSAADLATEREAVDAERARLEELTARAESEIREAIDARHRVEGELSAANRRIADLERELADAEQRRAEEVAEVRRTEREEFRLALREFATTVRSERDEPAAPAAAPAVTSDVVRRMAVRIERGDLTLSKDGRWLLGNADAINPAVKTIERMMKKSFLVIGEGDPAPVTLSDAYREATATE